MGQTKGNHPSLDSIKHNRNTSGPKVDRSGRPGCCGAISAVGVVEYDGEPTLGYAKLFCKSWKCPRCGPTKAAWYMGRIGAVAAEHKLSRLLTLTLDPSKLKEGENSGRYIRKVWAKFRIYVKRKYGKSLKYISVVEHTKKGVAHLHVLVDQYMDQKWISDAWSRLGGGKIVDIKAVYNVEQCGYYLGKYLSKDMIEAGFPGQRRVTTSRGITLQESKPGGSWELIHMPLEWIRKAMPDAHNDRLDKNGELISFVADFDFHHFAEDSGETVH